MDNQGLVLLINYYWNRFKVIPCLVNLTLFMHSRGMTFILLYDSYGFFIYVVIQSLQQMSEHV